MEDGKRRLAGDTARAATTDEVKDLRLEARDLKAVVAEQTLELRLLKKKHDRRWGRSRMRYPHLRSWRSFGWSKKATYRRAKHWQILVSAAW